MENVKHLIKGFVPVLILLFLCNIGIYAQSGISIRGTVVTKTMRLYRSLGHSER
jgi:hypothetical protein